MKCRAIILIDFDIEKSGGFKEAAEEQTKVEAAIANIVKDNKRVVHYQMDMKERRGQDSPDIKNMKFRSNH